MRNTTTNRTKAIQKTAPREDLMSREDPPVEITYVLRQPIERGVVISTMDIVPVLEAAGITVPANFSVTARFDASPFGARPGEAELRVTVQEKV